MPRADVAFNLLLVLTAALFLYVIYYVFLVAPEAQLAAGGLAQKIFYFHVPAASGMYIGGVICFFGSVAYMLRGTDIRNAVAKAGAEVAVIFGALMLTSGPLWAKKAWGVYWTWDPRLTTTMLTVLIFTAIVMLRTFAGDGEAERKFAAAFGVLGSIIMPIVHYSVQLWSGNHPKVISEGGQGLGDPRMYHALYVAMAAMSLLSLLFVWMRTRLAMTQSRLAHAEERAATAGILEEP